jgi:hypothetical protein
VKVDYSDEKSLQDALTGIQVVYVLSYHTARIAISLTDCCSVDCVSYIKFFIILSVSTISFFGLGAQIDMAKAAKAAGVQLFVPAEFGVEISDGMSSVKMEVKDVLKELQLPYALFHPGFFADLFHV